MKQMIDSFKYKNDHLSRLPDFKGGGGEDTLQPTKELIIIIKRMDRHYSCRKLYWEWFTLYLFFVIEERLLKKSSERTHFFFFFLSQAERQSEKKPE